MVETMFAMLLHSDNYNLAWLRSNNKSWDWLKDTARRITCLQGTTRTRRKRNAERDTKFHRTWCLADFPNGVLVASRLWFVWNHKMPLRWCKDVRSWILVWMHTRIRGLAVLSEEPHLKVSLSKYTEPPAAPIGRGALYRNQGHLPYSHFLLLLTISDLICKRVYNHTIICV